MPALKWSGTGLLSLLGVKTGGRLPVWSESPQVVPVLDLRDWISQDVQEAEYINASANFPGASTAPQGLTGFTVPSGQMWGLLGLSVSSGAIATGALQFNVGWSPNNATVGLFTLVESPLMTPSPGINSTLRTFYPTGILWLPPGTTMSAVPAVNTVVAATAVNCWARICRASL